MSSDGSDFPLGHQLHCASVAVPCTMRFCALSYSSQGNRLDCTPTALSFCGLDAMCPALGGTLPGSHAHLCCRSLPWLSLFGSALHGKMFIFRVSPRFLTLFAVASKAFPSATYDTSPLLCAVLRHYGIVLLLLLVAATGIRLPASDYLCFSVVAKDPYPASGYPGSSECS